MIATTHRLIDIFSSHFSFHYSDQKSKESKKSHLHKLNDFILQSLAEMNTVIVVSDVSIKNQVATSITYTHTHNNPIIKTIYYAINVTFTEVKLFTITYGINQAIQIANINCIVVITDSCYGMLWTLTFFFFFYLFSLILYFFSFEFLFLFPFSDDEEACDIAVT